MAPSCSPTTSCAFALEYACPEPAQLDRLLASADGLVRLRALDGGGRGISHDQLGVPVDQVRCCCAPAKPLHGRLCSTSERADECTANAHSASDTSKCPISLFETWSAKPGLPGFAPETNEAMACRANGAWLAPGVERFHPMNYGINRSSAFRIGREYCETMRWSYSKFFSQGPAILGSDNDIRTVLHRNKNLTVTRLTLRMGRPFALWRNDSHAFNTTNSGRLYTPCDNIAFVMCGVRGWLRGEAPPGLFYLATAGDQIGSRCNTCGTCRPDLSWDECWITKNEYCMLSKICENGDEVWHRKGFWRCKPRASMLRRLV